MTEHLYYADSFLTDFDAVVTEIHELSRANGQSLWRVALDRSAFYPTSGGQPHDTGQLLATARSGTELAAEIIDVEEDEHGEIWHHTAKPLSAGTPVRGLVDPARRLDHIQQHSGQHLLSAAFLQVSNAPTVSFHLGEAVSTIDLAIDALSEITLREVEELSNQIIAEDRQVRVSVISRAQAEALFQSGELRKLPPREGDIRVVEIMGQDAGEIMGQTTGEISAENSGGAKPFDRNACGGTHVRSAGQIGGLHLRGIEKVKQGWRVEFVCGLRAMRAARSDFQNLTEAGRQLSVGLAEIPEAIDRLQAEAKRSGKQLQAQMLELARYRAAEWIRETAPVDGIRRVHRQFSPADNADSAYMKLLASQLTAQGEKTAAVFAWCPAAKEEPATIIFARSRDLDFDCGIFLRETLSKSGGRGGGSKEMAQGSVPQDRLDAVFEALVEATKKM